MPELNTYLIPEIVALCLIVGFVLKHWVSDVDNKWIPTISCIVGVFAALAMKWADTPDIATGIGVCVGGALSGLASTGLHQMFKQWIDSGTK